VRVDGDNVVFLTADAVFLTAGVGVSTRIFPSSPVVHRPPARRSSLLPSGTAALVVLSLLPHHVLAFRHFSRWRENTPFSMLSLAAADDARLHPHAVGGWNSALRPLFCTCPRFTGVTGDSLKG
jgi:hypothetical protein